VLLEGAALDVVAGAALPAAVVALLEVAALLAGVVVLLAVATGSRESSCSLPPP